MLFAFMPAAPADADLPNRATVAIDDLAFDVLGTAAIRTGETTTPVVTLGQRATGHGPSSGAGQVAIGPGIFR